MNMLSILDSFGPEHAPLVDAINDRARAHLRSIDVATFGGNGGCVDSIDALRAYTKIVERMPELLEMSSRIAGSAWGLITARCGCRGT